MRTLRDFRRVSERVWFAEGPASNWSIVRGRSGGFVLIDAGYPKDAPLVLDSLRAAGVQDGTLTAILVTHAHTDHIGGIPGVLVSHPEAAVLSAPAEVAAVRGPQREQLTAAKAGARLLHPRFFRWALGAVRAGATAPLELPGARAFTPADLEAAGIRTHDAAGHTAGSTVFEVDGVLITGDAFVTDHPTYARPRRGAIAAIFSADAAAARAFAATVPVDRTLLPGHGPVLGAEPGR